MKRSTFYMLVIGARSLDFDPYDELKQYKILSSDMKALLAGQWGFAFLWVVTILLAMFAPPLYSLITSAVCLAVTILIWRVEIPPEYKKESL